jgi:hypothetical protein
LKGYLLILSTGPVKANTDVTWSIKEGGVETGTYHPDGAWASYNQTITKPTTQPAYWRSDVLSPIDSTFDISVTYTPEGQNQQVTINRQLKTRFLAPAVPALNGQFNPDLAILQRAMIDIFAINPGRLSSVWPETLVFEGGAPRAGAWEASGAFIFRRDTRLAENHPRQRHRLCRTSQRVACWRLQAAARTGWWRARARASHSRPITCRL